MRRVIEQQRENGAQNTSGRQQVDVERTTLSKELHPVSTLEVYSNKFTHTVPSRGEKTQIEERQVVRWGRRQGSGRCNAAMVTRDRLRATRPLLR